MLADRIKLVITYGTASIALLASLAVDAWAWSQPRTETSNDLAILFGVTGLIIGAVLAFLFNQESATRAARSSESAIREASVASVAATQALSPALIGTVGIPEPDDPPSPADVDEDVR